MATKIQEMPHNLEAEQSLLGCLLLDRDVQLDIIASLSESNFFSESHKYIFTAMVEIFNRNQPIDLVTLSDQLEKNATLEAAGGISYIANLTKIMPSTANYRHYYEIVTRDSTLRKLIKGASEIITEAQKSSDRRESVAFAEKTIFDIGNEVDTSEVVKINTVLPDVLSKFDAISKDRDAFKGVSTGFTKLDALTNGLQKTDLILIAARPSYGKTSLAMNIVENAALQGYSCAVFSLEMGREQLVQRMLCSVAEVNMQDAIKGNLRNTQWVNLAKAKENLNNAKIFIDDSSMITPEEMLSKCRRLKRKHGLDLVMVDYIQLMGLRKKTDNRQTEISEISRNLKILAKEINVPVIALSQLSRLVESRTGHKPQLSDLRESGAIEQDADIVMFIHRPDKNATEREIAENNIQRNVAEILIEKHRNGPTGTVKLYFEGAYTKFKNLTEDLKMKANMKIEGQDEAVEEEPPEEAEEYSENEGYGEEAATPNDDSEIF